MRQWGKKTLWEFSSPVTGRYAFIAGEHFGWIPGGETKIPASCVAMARKTAKLKKMQKVI